jgi:DNA polymerase
VDVAIDFEAFYSADISASMGVWQYARATDIYLVSMVADTGMEFVGHPKDAPWNEVAGQNWIMHNAGFDMTLFEALVEKGVIPSVEPSNVFDTADLVSFLQYPRSLKESAHYLLNIDLAKTTRDNMKNKKWLEMTPEFQKEVCEYALLDSRYTLQLWQNYSVNWPETERQVSKMTREMAMRGVPVNKSALENAIVVLDAEAEGQKAKLPWVGGERPPLSLDAIREQCAKEGIYAPASFSEKEETAQKWEEEFSEKYPWIAAVRAYRKANKHLKAVTTMLSRMKPDGRMPYEIKYYGTTTGRDSGSGGWNCQNIPKGEIAGVDIRKLIEAPEGKSLVVCDLAQIESRVICYLAGDTATLDILRSGIDIYEAHARTTMGYKDPRPLKEVDNDLRQLAKARVLGLGFGCGPAKFQIVAWIMARIAITPKESDKIVRDYRASNPKIASLWRKLERLLNESMGSNFIIELPMGRKLIYREVVREGKGSSCVISRNGKMMRSKVYGGLLAENYTQAFAACVFMNRCMSLEEAGYEIIMRVHDEAVILVPERTAELHRANIEKIMSTSPDWCKKLPLGAEASVCKQYTK